MNTIKSLVENGIDKQTAKKMIDNYKSHIGTMNGIYNIIDINYDFDQRGRVVRLKCSECGNIINRTMISGRNKWSELIKTCGCQKAQEKISLERRKIADIEKQRQDKKEQLEKHIGSRYGDYDITDVILGKPDKFTMKCNICGKKIEISAYMVLNGMWKNNKCHSHYQRILFDESYIGRKNNFLTVIRIIRQEDTKRKFVCKCDCGKETLVAPFDWQNGRVKSCGCKQRELLREANWNEFARNKKRLYRIWTGMKQRCYNEKCCSYVNYGGRGINICQEWVNNYDEFEKWALSHGYADNLSIDRIDVNGNYEPANCRWADAKTQYENRRPKEEWKPRKGSLWTINGVTKQARSWCSDFGMSCETVRYRINVKGMSHLEALSTPKETSGRPRKAVVQ